MDVFNLTTAHKIERDIVRAIIKSAFAARVMRRTGSRRPTAPPAISATRARIEPKGGRAMARTIEARVREAWRNAAANGYDFGGSTAREVAEDMIEFDADLEDEDLADVIAAVERVRAAGAPSG